MISGLIATALLGVTLAAEPPVLHLTMAAALLASGESRYEAPEEIEIKGASTGPLKQEVLPARAPGALINQSPNPPVAANGKPRAEMPPVAIRMAQLSEDEKQRQIQQLEEQIKRLKETPTSTPQAPPTPAQSNARPDVKTLPQQMVPGWRISLHEWNPAGEVNTEPLKVFHMKNGRFSALLGQERSVPFDPVRQVRRSRDNHTMQMFVYKLDGFLNVTTPGDYHIGVEMNCPWGHGCNLLMRVGDQQIFNQRDRNYENKLVFEKRYLEAGAYRVELVFNIAKNKFVNFQPGSVLFFPVIRAPSEFNFRDFRPDELVTEANASIPTGMPRR